MSKQVSMFDSFPPVDREGAVGNITRGLSGAVDQILNDWADWWDNYERNLVNPETVAADLLDFVGTLPSSPWRAVGWNPGWSETAKRRLLSNTVPIFRDRYTPEALSQLFNCFDSEAKVEYLSGWILGGPGVGTPLGPTCILGGGLTSYRIRIPSHYKRGTKERAIVDWCLANFGLPLAIDVVAS